MPMKEPGLFLVSLALIAGLASAAQPSVNAGLAARSSLSAALLFNSVVVLIGCVIYFVAAGPRSPVVPGTPWYFYLGGIFGLTIITTMPLVVPRLGPALALALWVLGLGVGGLLIEYFGLWGIRRGEIGLDRLLGVLLLFVGVLLIRR
ncbi:MAG: DMT family transporter [Myxococcales bacterium]|nr:DMT family transporter [Myxococcales bacterium]